MSLPQFNSDLPVITLLQDKWASQLDPLLAQPTSHATIIQNVVLSSSSVINHTLGRNLIGYQVIRQRGAASIYDRQDTNLSPDKTLLLTSSSGVSVDILCF